MEYMSMAQACGEEPVRMTGWIPGVDFDPHDDDEMEVMHAVWERESHDENEQLRREIHDLRAQLATYEETD